MRIVVEEQLCYKWWMVALHEEVHQLVSSSPDTSLGIKHLLLALVDLGLLLQNGQAHTLALGQRD